MAMGDAAAVYADLMMGGDGKGVIPIAAPPAIDHHQTNVMAPVEIGPVTPVERRASGEREPKLKPGYPDYVDDPDGLARFREQVKRYSGHDMAICNNNSLGRLIDTIERLRAERDALAASPATPAGSVREADIDAAAARIAMADGLDWSEQCAHEVSEDTDLCGSGTCIAAHDEDHDPAAARDYYRRHARAALHPVDSCAQGGEK